jgi:hypothetical protein
MAQRKSAPPTSKKPAGKPGTKPAARPGAAKAAAATQALNKKSGAKKPGKSIVNQKQTPWGLIITTVVLVALAGGIVIFAVTQHKSSPVAAANKLYTQPETAAAQQITGLVHKVEPNHTHVEGTIKYDTTPPTGGNHSQYWADCSGTVYAQPIANENAVHMLEHGAVWITYNSKTLPAAQLDVLKKLVDGVDRMALSPYPDLTSNISLQAWGYQLFVNSASDPRIQQFINALRYNPKVTPEPSATCSQPQFKTHPSTFGHPLWVPAT